MAIKIGGTSIINDDGSISNVGIVTIGLGGTTGEFKVGTGVTIDGAGNAYFDGYITVNGGITYLEGLVSMQPQDTYLTDNNILGSWDGNLDLTFDSPVEVASGTTSIITLRRDSTTGGVIATAGISSINYPGVDFSILRVAFGGITTSLFSGIATYYPIIPDDLINFTVTGNNYAGNFSGDPKQNTLSFEFKGPDTLGDPAEGGYMICASGGNAWIVSPYEAEVSRSWYSRNDPVTRAQQVSGCTGWFTPTLAQYQNPGYTCRTYWDSYSPTNYWTLDKRPGTGSFFYLFNMENAVVNIGPPYPAGWGNGIHCVRAFRCVTY